MAKPQQPDIKVEQKLLKIMDDPYTALRNDFRDGWIIKQISACATQYTTYCYILLEKTTIK